MPRIRAEADPRLREILGVLVASVLSDITDAVTGRSGTTAFMRSSCSCSWTRCSPLRARSSWSTRRAVAAGAFAGQSVTLFGHELESGFSAYLAMALAGTLGYTVGSVMGWAIGDYGGRPYSSDMAAGCISTSEAGPRRGVVRAVGGLGRLPRSPHSRRSLVHLRSRGCVPRAVRALHGAHARRLGDLASALAQDRLGAGLELGDLPPRGFADYLVAAAVAAGSRGWAGSCWGGDAQRGNTQGYTEPSE